MNVLTIFEQRISAIFDDGAPGERKPFSFKRLAKRAVREMEDETFVIDGVDTAPALYTILVSSKDDYLMRPMYVLITNEISQLIEAQAKKRGYTFVGKPLVRFMVDPALRGGKFAVFAENIDPRTLARLRDEENAYLGITSPQEIMVEQGFVPQPVPVHDEEPAPVAQAVAYVGENLPVRDEVAASETEAQLWDEEFDDEGIASPADDFEQFEEASDDASDVLAEPAYEEDTTPVTEEDVNDLVNEMLDEADDYESEPLSPAEPEPLADEPKDELQPARIPLTVPEVAVPEIGTPEAPEVEVPQVAVPEVPGFDEVEPSAPEPSFEEVYDAEPVADAHESEDAYADGSCDLIDLESGERHHLIPGTTVSIGRERKEGGIVLHDPNVSRRHAEVFFRNGAWRVRDLNSTNGTLVNDVDVSETWLHDGDVLTLGLTTLEFRMG